MRIRGWGHLLGDKGSGFWIGLQAIKAALKSRAGVSAKSALEERVMQRFGADDDRLVIREAYSTSFSEAEVAGLTRLSSVPPVCYREKVRLEHVLVRIKWPERCMDRGSFGGTIKATKSTERELPYAEGTVRHIEAKRTTTRRRAKHSL